MSDIQDKKRQNAKASAAILGYAQSDRTTDWWLRKRKDLHWCAEIDTDVVYQQTVTADVHITFTSVSYQDDYCHLKRNL